MFDNLNTWEFAGLLLLALLIFGDKLPKVIGDGMRLLRNLRNMATNATGDLSRELGTDVKLEDLNPKAFMRKHLLSEEDEAVLRRPLQGLYDDVRGEVNHVKGIADDFRTPMSTPAAGLSDDPRDPRPITRSFDDAT